ncbi:MAG: hypothetical protein Q8L34_02075 [Candidatus Woesearchaeota archaeon]|nr:hypothetical protein [Candidatus Woesearchaeota archaeon]
MTSVTFALPEKTKEEMKKFSWVNWSEVARETILTKEKLFELLKKTESKEEKEFTEWSVALGRKIKKGRWERLLKKLSPEEREELLGE